MNVTDKAGDVEINYKYTSIPYLAKKWLDGLEVDMIALDFETTGLGHPSKTGLTHLSVATSPTEGFVLIFSQYNMEKIVLKWLVETSIKQIWHNFVFDGKHIYFRKLGLPKDFEDSQQLAKSLLNHVDVWKANTSLKELMGWRYGKWAIAADDFGYEKMHDPDVIKYAAIDAMATYQLWLDIQGDLHGEISSTESES